jgi:hypothetical protein
MRMVAEAPLAIVVTRTAAANRVARTRMNFDFPTVCAALPFKAIKVAKRKPQNFV